MWEYYDKICAEKDKKQKKLYEKWLSTQEQWFTRWVREMIRIAKPGSPIILEQISQAYCDNDNDWDGVRQKFWKTFVADKQNGVDPHSLDMEPNKVDEDRYNVFMKKRK
uniref:Uncharacterized protein n=2 Tax=Entomoneis paludosa TaxID=265537 RepID=A0A7S2Y8C2_9STRA